MSATVSTAAPAQTPMTHREILEALSGLLLAMFVAMLSSTVVSNALPRIVTDLHGSQTGYTWVVVATLLTMTATTPIWGKLADLFSKKLLVQSALVIYVIGSLIAGLAPSMGVLIGARAIQGLGIGGLTALVQVVIASMVTPRERGRYSGYLGAVFAIATVSGPLIGGVIVDTPGLGWRWCFFVGIPVAVLAFGVLQKTLHLPVIKREVHIDYLGATLLMGGVSVLLVWVSLAGNNFAWGSTISVLLVVLGLALLAATVYVEARVALEPVIPLRLFKDRTTSLATAASVMIGIAMFGSTVYLSQYFQLARGMTPTHAGLMSIAMVGGLLVSSIVTGKIISDTGSWKKYLVGGMVAVIRRTQPALDDRRPHQPGDRRTVHGRPRGRPRRDHAEPGAGRPEQRRAGRHGLGQRRGRVLPVHGRIDRRLGARRRTQPPGRHPGGLGSGGTRHLQRRPGQPLDSRPRHAAGSGPGGLRERVRRRDRSPVPGRRPVRRHRLRVRAVHQGGPAADDPAEREGARRGGRFGTAGPVSPTMTHRVETLRTLEQEMGVVVRRVRRVIVERARAVDPELQIAGFLVLSFLAGKGPARSADVVEELGIDKGAISRHVQHLIDLGLVSREPDPCDGRASILSVTEEGVLRMAVVAEHRRHNLQRKLADWTDDDLVEFVDSLSRYNRSLS